MRGRMILMVLFVLLFFCPFSVNTDGSSLLLINVSTVHAQERLLGGVLELVDSSTGGILSMFSNALAWIVQWAFTIIGSMFVYFGALILGISGALFDFLLRAFGSEFTTTLTTLGITPVIGQVWVVFRDLSQIVLIGFFIFIAINIILNNHEYSIKQHAVRAILVALFMNFSLFFSMAVIDVSNFVAYQFYRGIAGVGGQTTESRIVGINGGSNVSHRIITAYGISSLNNYGAFVSGLKDSGGSGWGGVVKIVATSIGITILLLVASFTFFYCSLLLLRRGVVLTLLMMSSSLAVAALILPKTSQYFSQWRTALLANALFAPVLLILLWTVIQIMDAVSRSTTATITPDLFSSAGMGQAGGSLVRYAFLIMIFYAAIKIADTLAKKGNEFFGMGIGGAGFGAALGGTLAAAPFAALQGRLRSRSANRYQSELDQINKEMKAAGEGGHEAKVGKLQENREKLQKRIDAGGTMAGSNIDKILSKINKAVTGKDTKSSKVGDLIKKNATEKKKGKEKEEEQARLLEPFARQQLKEKEGAHAAGQEEQMAKNYQEATAKLTEEIKSLKEGITEKTQKFTVQESDLSKLRDQVDADAKKVATASPGTISDPERREMDQRRGELTSKSAQIAELKKQIDADNDKIANQSASIAKLNETGGPEVIAKRKREREASLREEQARTQSEQQRADRAMDVVKSLGLKGDGATFLQQRIIKSASDVAREDRYKSVAAQLAEIQEASNKPAAAAPTDAATGAAPMVPKAPEKH